VIGSGERVRLSMHLREQVSARSSKEGAVSA
jgi:hypothetical protein